MRKLLVFASLILAQSPAIAGYNAIYHASMKLFVVLLILNQQKNTGIKCSAKAML